MQKNQLAVTLEPADRLWVRTQAALQGRSESNFVAFCVRLQQEKLRYVDDKLRAVITRCDQAIFAAQAAATHSEQLPRWLREIYRELDERNGRPLNKHSA